MANFPYLGTLERASDPVRAMLRAPSPKIRHRQARDGAWAACALRSDRGRGWIDPAIQQATEYTLQASYS